MQPATEWNPSDFIYDDAYYATVEPSCITQTRPLQPGELLPKIKIASPGLQWALPDTECEHPLRVIIPPDMPCTFYAEDWGCFQNGKKCITVKSDAQGIAEAIYTTPQSYGGSMVLAHSPEAMGTIQFSIKVVNEKELAQIKKREEERRLPADPDNHKD